MIAAFAVPVQQARAGGLYPTILVTAAPLQPIVDALLDGAARSQLLTHAGQDAHTMVLSPSQSKALQTAEMIVVPDREMNNVVSGLVAQAETRGARVIALSELRDADPLPYPIRQPWLGDAQEQVDTNELTDPHLWLDPLRMAAIATPLADALTQAMPAAKTTLQANASALSRHLRREVHPALETMLADRPARMNYSARDSWPFVTDHQAYQYFLTRYGIDNPGALLVRPEDYLGARSSRNVLKRAGQIRLRCVIGEQETATTRAVMAASHARFVRASAEIVPDKRDVPALPWIQNGYDRLLYRIARQFADCLQK